MSSTLNNRETLLGQNPFERCEGSPSTPSFPSFPSWSLLPKTPHFAPSPPAPSWGRGQTTPSLVCNCANRVQTVAKKKNKKKWQDFPFMQIYLAPCLGSCFSKCNRNLHHRHMTAMPCVRQPQRIFWNQNNFTDFTEESTSPTAHLAVLKKQHIRAFKSFNSWTWGFTNIHAFKNCMPFPLQIQGGLQTYGNERSKRRFAFILCH